MRSRAALRAAFDDANDRFLEGYDAALAEEAAARHPDFTSRMGAAVEEHFTTEQLSELTAAFRARDPSAALDATETGRRYKVLSPDLVVQADGIAATALEDAWSVAFDRFLATVLQDAMTATGNDAYSAGR